MDAGASITTLIYPLTSCVPRVCEDQTLCYYTVVAILDSAHLYYCPQDNEEHCSSVGDNSGDFGPSNLMKDEGAWQPLPIDEGQPQWVLFDLGEEYLIDDLEIVTPPDCPQRPKECSLQFRTGAGQWWKAAVWVGEMSKQTETIKVGTKIPIRSQKWKLIVDSTYGGSAAPIVNSVRFHGRKAHSEERPNPSPGSRHHDSQHDADVEDTAAPHAAEASASSAKPVGAPPDSGAEWLSCKTLFCGLPVPCFKP